MSNRQELDRLWDAAARGPFARTKKFREQKRAMRRMEKRLTLQLGFDMINTRWKKRHFAP